METPGCALATSREARRVDALREALGLDGLEIIRAPVARRRGDVVEHGLHDRRHARP